MCRRRFVPLAFLIPVALTGCALTPPGTTTAGSAGTADGTVACDFRVTGTPSRPVDPPADRAEATGTATVTLEFGGGRVPIELDRAAAPCTVASFVSLAGQGFYDRTTCHRLSTQSMFILQCGDPTGTGQGGPGYTFDDELAATTGYPAGTVAMANSGADTNGSQFFLVYEDSPLPLSYTVFGHMDEAGTQLVGDMAFLGHDSSFGDGTGRPYADTTIRTAVSG